jgi:Domain of unknown function (DUF4157)
VETPLKLVTHFGVLSANIVRVLDGLIQEPNLRKMGSMRSYAPAKSPDVRSSVPRRSRRVAPEHPRSPQLLAAMVAQRTLPPSLAAPAQRDVVHLQRTRGNRRVRELLGNLAPSSKVTTPDSSRLSQGAAGAVARPGIQINLGSDNLGDSCEQEADSLSTHMSTSAINTARRALRGPLQRASEGSAGHMDAPPSFGRALATPGSLLEPTLRQDMEQRFGHDFARVRVHSDEAAARSAHDVNAMAYTVGHHIVFGAHMLQPATQEGRRLIAHELAHVLQQYASDGGTSAPAPALIQRAIPDRSNKRHLTATEVREAKLVFGTALKTDDIVISEGGLMTVGGYSRTVPDRIYFLSGEFSLPLLIHELTHVWQYQRGEGWGDLPGMTWEAVVGKYDYGGEDGLRKAWEEGTAFSEFTTEQQGDILQHYYVRLKARSDVSAYEPFVNDVRAGREKVHRYKTVEPLPHATLDVWKLNREHRDKQEVELIAELRRPMSPDDRRAVARANRVLELFAHTYWRDYYRERILARRTDDVLIQLVYSQLSAATRKRIFAVLGLDTSAAH